MKVSYTQFKTLTFFIRNTSLSLVGHGFQSIKTGWYIWREKHEGNKFRLFVDLSDVFFFFDKNIMCNQWKDIAFQNVTKKSCINDKQIHTEAFIVEVSRIDKLY